MAYRRTTHMLNIHNALANKGNKRVVEQILTQVHRHEGFPDIKITNLPRVITYRLATGTLSYRITVMRDGKNNYSFFFWFWFFIVFFVFLLFFFFSKNYIFSSFLYLISWITCSRFYIFRKSSGGCYSTQRRRNPSLR